MAVVETMAAGDKLFLLFAYMFFLLIVLVVMLRHVKTSDPADVILVHFSALVITAAFLGFALESGEFRYVALGAAALAFLLAYYALESSNGEERWEDAAIPPPHASN